MIKAGSAREAMERLLAGDIVRHDDCYTRQREMVKMSDDTLYYYDFDKREWTRMFRDIFNRNAACFTEDEYPLSFGEALMKMVRDGKICEDFAGSLVRFNSVKGRFEVLTRTSTKSIVDGTVNRAGSWEITAIGFVDQVYGWRIASEDVLAERLSDMGAEK